jgi:hypothetical protein
LYSASWPSVADMSTVVIIHRYHTLISAVKLSRNARAFYAVIQMRRYAQEQKHRLLYAVQTESTKEIGSSRAPLLPPRPSSGRPYSVPNAAATPLHSRFANSTVSTCRCL